MTQEYFESIRESGIEKWKEGLEHCTDVDAFFGWWYAVGCVTCKHCLHYCCESIHNVDAPMCPLWVEGVS